MTDAVLLQVACVAFKNDTILKNVRMADVKHTLRNFNFHEETRKQNIGKTKYGGYLTLVFQNTHTGGCLSILRSFL